MVRKVHKKKTLREEREARKPRKLTFCCILILHRLYFNQFILEFRINKRYVIHWKKRIMCRIRGTWHDSSTVNITVEEFCQYRKKKKFCPWLLNNRASDCCTIVPVTVEQSRQWLSNNCASDCWWIVPATIEESYQWLLINRASECWTIACQRLLHNRVSDC